MKKNKKNSSEKIFGIEVKIIDECLYQGNLGDGILYGMLYGGKDPEAIHVRHCTTTDQAMIFDRGRFGHHWVIDEYNWALGLVDNIAILYLNRARQIGKEIAVAAENKENDKQKNLEAKRKFFESKALSLRKKAGRAACYEYARSNLAENISVKLDQFDKNPFLLAGPNGVFELDTGEFRPGKPTDYCLKHMKHNLPENLDVPDPKLWLTFLKECHDYPDLPEKTSEIVNFLQRYCGYCLTGLVDEHITPIHDGAGANGKTIFQQIIFECMGEYAGPIQAEMLMDPGRARSASAPTPDIMGLQGKRLVVASESDEARRFSAARLKWLTGGDTLVGRRPHDKTETTFSPSHKLMLLTNNLPHTPPDDFAFWRRVVRVHWPNQFVENPTNQNEKKKDDRLYQKLKDEVTGILAWMIRGCLWWNRDGLQIPASITEFIDEYKSNENIFEDFLAEHCVKTEGRTLASALYERFTDWFTKYHGKRVPTMHWFGRRMGKHYTRKKNEDGVTMYLDVRLIELKKDDT